MYLTLEVVSPQAASLGADRRRTVDQNGLTIGRNPGNDWVIPDPYISKQHARITYSDGNYFVESLGRNAIAIGSPGNTLPGNQLRALRNGDRLFIDQYEMIVTTMQGDPPGAPLASDDPFAVLAPGGNSLPAAGRPSNAVPDIWNNAEGPDFADTGVVDPMEVLGGAASPQPPPLPPVDWQRGSVLEDHFDAPAPRKPTGGSPFDLLAPSGEAPAENKPSPPSAIPDNWDRTNITNVIAREPAPSPVPRSPLPAPAGARNAPVRPANPRPVYPAPVEPRPYTSEPRSRTADPRPQPVPAARSAMVDPPLQSAAPVGMSADLAELLRGAGIPAHQISPEVLQDLGKVLRVVVEGVMDVLRARAEIKSHFRLPMTRIQSEENNPLKHSPNVESALNTLLVQRNPGFLSTVQSFEDAFADIRNHQMAMLEGLRVAFDSMLEKFDPKELEQGFDAAGRRGFGSSKAKYWDQYAQRFAQLSKDADDTYRRLFGDVFAEAYERQLERLKLLDRTGGKS